MIEEIHTYISYSDLNLPLYYWRTASGFEVDLIIGEMDLAIEFKASNTISVRDMKSIKVLMEEHKVKQSIIVCLEEKPRQVKENLTILPWQIFCKKLWSNDFF